MKTHSALESTPASVPTISEPKESSSLLDFSADQKRNGVKGWLLLLCLSLTIFTPLVTAYSLAVGYSQASPHFDTVPGLGSLFLMEGLLSGGLMVYSIFAGVYLWTIRPNAPDFAKGYLKAVMAYAVLACFLPFFTGLPTSASTAVAAAAVIQLIRAIIFVGIWTSYLNKSRRVKATYPTVPSLVPPVSNED